MAKKSSGGISISSIIFLVIMYNFIFSEDDKKEVDIIEQDKVVQTSPEPKSPTIKDQFKEIGEELKETGKELKKEVLVIVDDLKDEFKETPKEQEDNPKVEEEKPKPEVVPESKPEKDSGMKRL